QAGARRIVGEDLGIAEMLIVAQARLHLRADALGPADIALGPAPGAEVGRVLVARRPEALGRAARDMVELEQLRFLGAGLEPPCPAPAVRPAGAEADDADRLDLLGEAVQMRRHRAARRM